MSQPPDPAVSASSTRRPRPILRALRWGGAGAVLLAVLVIGMTVFGILRYDSAAFSAQSHGEAKQGHEIEGGTAVQGEDNDRD